MKNAVILGVIGLLALGAYFVGSMADPSRGTATGVNSELSPPLPVDIPGKPDRTPDIGGNLVTVASDRLVVSKREDAISDDDRAEQRDRMRSMSESERQALREERRKVAASGEKMPIFLSARTKVFRVVENRAEEIPAASLQVGRGVSVWTDAEGSAAFVVQGAYDI